MRGTDHLHVRRSTIAGKLSEQIFPDAAPGPAHEAVIDRRRRTIFGRAITPAAAAPEHMNDPADHAAVVHAFLAANIRRQMPFNPRPLLIAQPKQIPAHDPNPLLKENQNRILRPEDLMSSDPNWGTKLDFAYNAVSTARNVSRSTVI